MYYVYLLRCADHSLYTGITTDPARRLAEHRGRGGRGARYPRSRGACALAAVFTAEDRAQASRLEYRIKRLPKEKQEALIREAERPSGGAAFSRAGPAALDRWTRAGQTPETTEVPLRDEG